MAMPASGTIAIISAPQTCGSICAAIGCASGSLSTLSVVAGKTAPHAMTEFYGYTNTYKQIGLCNISAAGTNGTSSRCSTDCICSNSAMVAGQCYTITLCHTMCANTCTGSLSCIIVYCNGSGKYSCSRSNTNCATVTFSCSFAITSSDTACIMQCAVHGVAGGTGISCACSCITSVAATLGLFCKTTGCSDCCVYTC
jgi:hypothetical protein